LITSKALNSNDALTILSQSQAGSLEVSEDELCARVCKAVAGKILYSNDLPIVLLIGEDVGKKECIFVWSIFTDKALECGGSLVYAVRRLLDEVMFEQKLEFVYTVGDEDNRMHERWIMALGFKPDTSGAQLVGAKMRRIYTYGIRRQLQKGIQEG